MTRHPLDTLSLVFGLLFTAVGFAALADAIDLELFTVDWLWPAVLIGSGIAVLLTLTSRERSDAPASGTASSSPDDAHLRGDGLDG